MTMRTFTTKSLRSVFVAAALSTLAIGCGQDADDTLEDVSEEQTLAQQSPARPTFPGFPDGGLPGFPGRGQLDEAKIKELVEKLKAALDEAGVKLPERPAGGERPSLPGRGQLDEAELKELIEKVKAALEEAGVKLPERPGAQAFQSAGGQLDEAKIKELFEKLKAALEEAGIKLPERPAGGERPAFPSGGGQLDEAKIKELIEKVKAALEEAGIELPEPGKFPGFPGATAPKKP
ncbi:MAG: hypothetical protein ABW252_18410 [Polyangiales bacterium]